MSNKHVSDSAGESLPNSTIQYRPFHLTPSKLPLLRRFLSILRTEVPRDFRTFILSFLVGSVLSFPIGFVFAFTIRPFEPPTWVEPIYFGVVIPSFVLLPLWSHFALRRQPILRRLGLTTFLLGLFIFILGSLFPAL